MSMTKNLNASDVLSDLTVWMKYARYKRDHKRRETWTEICNRNRQMHLEKFGEDKSMANVINTIYDKFVIPKKVLPSMRSMQFAGEAIKQHNTRMFNCAYAPIDCIEVFGEIMFLLLGGTGMGYSVQQRHIQNLPEIKKPSFGKFNFYGYKVQDSIEGWGDAVKELLRAFTGGRHRYPKFDFSLIRPRGTELITSGGKAPGPEPLKLCLHKIELLLDSKEDGECLTDLEVHDIICHIADAVYAGGIRRAALICLFDRRSQEMLNCKSSTIPTQVTNVVKQGGLDSEGNLHDWELDLYQEGRLYTGVKFAPDSNGNPSFDYQCLIDHGVLGWWVLNPQRGRANNSVVLERGDSSVNKYTFLKIWEAVEASGSGEPGVYWTNNADWGTNPCVETALRPYQFCNLVEINASNLESGVDAYERVWAATVLGTLQASYTDFNYLRSCWKKNTELDALLGVSMTGLASNSLREVGCDEEQLARYARAVNEEYSSRIGINESARITCIKPAGTTSLTLGTSSGVHAWHDRFYIRRLRVGKQEAIYNYLLENCPEIVEDCKFNPDLTAIVSVPQKAPAGALIRGEETALQMLERIKKLSVSWIYGGHVSGDNSHNISATISLKPGEWSEVGEWMWENRNFYNGISVLPYDGGTYVQAPFESISEEVYDDLVGKLKSIDLSQVVEEIDQTDLVHELACVGGVCELP